MTPFASRISAVLLIASAVARAAPPPAPPAPDLWVDSETGMTFLRVKPGVFTMGSPADEHGREVQEQPHTVRITRPY